MASSRDLPNSPPKRKPLAIDLDCDDELSDEDATMEECGRWDNGRLTNQCTKAGSEECDWICPLSGDLRYRRPGRR